MRATLFFLLTFVALLYASVAVPDEGNSLRNRLDFSKTFQVRADETYLLQSTSGVNLGYFTLTCNANGTVSVSLYATNGFVFDETSVWVGSSLSLPTRNYPRYYPHRHLNVRNDLDIFPNLPIEGCNGNNTCFRIAIFVLVSRFDGCAANPCVLRNSSEICTDRFVVGFPGSTSYFHTLLNGKSYDGWCVDVGRHIQPGQLYNARLWSAYDNAFPDGLVDRSDRFDEITWLINQWYDGECGNPYAGCSWQSLQVAIWNLIDATPNNLEGADADCVSRMVADAIANGNGYIPPCKGRKIVVLVPSTLDGGNCTLFEAQITIIIEIINDCIWNYTVLEGYGVVAGSNVPYLCEDLGESHVVEICGICPESTTPASQGRRRKIVPHPKEPTN